MKNRFFQTADLYLASAICVILNTAPDYRVEKGRTLFVFPASDDLFRAMNEYNDGMLLNALEFTQTIKKLRAVMLMRRESGR